MIRRSNHLLHRDRVLLQMGLQGCGHEGLLIVTICLICVVGVLRRLDRVSVLRVRRRDRACPVGSGMLLWSTLGSRVECGGRGGRRGEKHICTLVVLIL